MAAAIRTALREEDGSVLAFLPGVAEIERTADALGPLPADVDLHKLHGGIEPAAQRAALAPPPSGQAKARARDQHRRDQRHAGRRADRRRQRAGATAALRPRGGPDPAGDRAGEPGSGDAARGPRRAPGARHCDPAVGRSGKRLASRARSAGNPRSRPFRPAAQLHALGRGGPAPRCPSSIRRPRPRSTKRARDWPTSARSSSGRVTDHGRAIASAAARAAPRAHDDCRESARIRCCCSGRRGAADRARPRRQRSGPGVRAGAAGVPTAPRARRRARRMAANWLRRGAPAADRSGDDLGKALALAFPDRVSRRRDTSGESWQSVGGRGFRLDPASPLARSEWLAVGEVAGHASGARILSAAPIDEADVPRPLRRPNRDSPRRRVRSGDRIGDSDAEPAPRRDPSVERSRSRARSRSDRAGAGRRRARARARLCCLGTSAAQLRHRAAFAHRFDAGDPAARRRVAHGADRRMACAAARHGKRRLGDMRRGGLASALEQLLGYDAAAQARPRSRRPSSSSPAGSRHAIDYSADSRADRRSPRPGPVRPGPASRRSPTARCRWCSPSPRPPGGRSRRPRTSRASGRAAGATSSRTCAGATRSIPGPTTRRRRRRRCGPSARPRPSRDRHHQMRIRRSGPHHIRRRCVRLGARRVAGENLLRSDDHHVWPGLDPVVSAVGLVA